MQDKTNHNALAEQFAARLMGAANDSVAQAEKKPRAPRKPKDAPPAEPVIVAEAPATAPVAAEPGSRIITSGPQIILCEQNSPEWHRARLGIPTASSFQAIMTPGKTKTEQKTRQTYLFKLAGEIITGQPMEMVMTRDMERGHAMEPEARDLYALSTGALLEQVGFIRNGRAGCSPDSLIGSDGGLEIKTKAPHLLIDCILKDEFPEEHVAQVQGTLWLAEREWWDLSVYWPAMPQFVKKATRDEAYIRQLAGEVDRFNDDLDAIVEQMRARMGEDFTEFAAAA